MSKSYPYLALAHEHHVDYGDVLSYADFIDPFRAREGYWCDMAARRLPYPTKVRIMVLVGTMTMMQHA